MVLAAASLFVRYRRAGSEGREQLKWFLYAGSFFLVGLGLLFFGGGSVVADNAGVTLILVGWVGMSVACAVAILKYHLYDIDLVINKTVVFGLLAAFVTAMYVLIVVGMGSAVGATEQGNVALSIVATAAVAVAFHPVRERVQRLANHLVYGTRATPYEVLATFSETMATSFAADELLPRMTEMVVKGTGATSSEVWVTMGPQLHRAAVHPSNGRSASVLAMSDGRPPDIPGATRSIPIRHRGDVLGVLAVTKAPGDPLLPAEDKLVSDLAAQAGLVLRNVGLIEELKASRQRIVAAQDEERRRIERNIHDGAQQRLVTVALALRQAGSRLRPDADPDAASMIAKAADELTDALAELRDLARGIHPAILTDAGLVAAVESLAERCPIPVRVASDAIGRLSPSIEVTAYFVVSEALANVVKHARASAAFVRLTEGNGYLAIEVRDDGIGGADLGGGSGLRGLEDRVAALDGSLSVSSVPETGTTVQARIPCG
jgi:signal transduction histidine kinase